MENAAARWNALTDGGGLCTEQVGVGGELVVGRGIQYGMGWAVVQKGHLTLPDGGGGLVQGGGGGRRGWGEQTGWRRGREGATWRTHTHTHTLGKVCYFMEGNQCCLMKVNHNLFSFFSISQLYFTRQNYWIYANYPVQKFKYPWFVSFNTNDCFLNSYPWHWCSRRILRKKGM